MNAKYCSPYFNPHTFNIMGRIHCEAPDHDALMHAVSVLANVATIPGKNLAYFVAQCMNAHHTNAAEYRDIMGGR